MRRIDEWEETLVSPKQQTFQDVINFPNRLNAELLYLAEAITGQEPPITAGVRQRWEDLRAQWQRERAARDRLLQEVAAFNTLIRENTIPAVIVPPAKRTGSI